MLTRLRPCPPYASVMLMALISALTALALAEGAAAAFPGSNGKIVFTNYDNSADEEIFTMNGAGGDQNPFTTNDTDDFDPAWSADGKWVAFHCIIDGDQICKMRRDGSGFRQLTEESGGYSARPAWAPSGNKIVFTTFDGIDTQISKMNSDGTSPQQLTEDGGFDPAWSPNGKKIAYDNDDEIWTMDADGSDEQNLTDNDAADESANWSPDGARIAFASDREGDWDIFKMSATGSGENPVTSTQRDDFSPAWSPNGKKIVFERFILGVTSRELFTMDKDGTNLNRLTNDSANDEDADWGPRPGG